MVTVTRIIFAILVGFYASSKGRSGFGFFLITALLSPLIGFIIALALSTNERVALVEQLLQSLDAPSEEINEIWAKEADARVSAYEKGEITSKSSSDS